MQDTFEKVNEMRNAEAMSDRIEKAYKFADLSDYKFSKRFLIRLIDLCFYISIALVGKTTRYEVDGNDYLKEAANAGSPPIYSLWHSCIFLGTYFLRDRQMVVMTSRSFDGEYIARFIQRFGFGTARGSSSRGAVGALIELARIMRAGKPVAFTVDGPRGPRHIAKMGAIALAKRTGNPILAFNVTPKHFLRLKSWDGLEIPLPCSRALVTFAPPLRVSADADDGTMQAKLAELQRILDELVARGEEWRRN